MALNYNLSSAYKIYEYLLVLAPHEELRTRIMQVKKEFAEKYQADLGLYGKPHLALVSFKQYVMSEERLIHRLKISSMSMPPIKIELKDFGSFPSHSIYINVTSRLQVEHLVKTIRTDAQALMKMDKENKPHFMMQPNFSIARKLAPWQYEKGWLEYSHRHFTGRFIADSMLMLKRALGEKKYQIAARFEFSNLPVSTIQGALFS